MRQVEHFYRAFSTLVFRVLEMGLETQAASDVLSARQCWMGRETCQLGEAAARFMP